MIKALCILSDEFISKYMQDCPILLETLKRESCNPESGWFYDRMKDNYILFDTPIDEFGGY